MMRLMRSYLVPVSSSSLCLPKLRFYLGLFREGKHLGILSWWYQRPVYSRREMADIRGATGGSRSWGCVGSRGIRSGGFNGCCFRVTMKPARPGTRTFFWAAQPCRWPATMRQSIRRTPPIVNGHGPCRASSALARLPRKFASSTLKLDNLNIDSPELLPPASSRHPEPRTTPKTSSR